MSRLLLCEARGPVTDLMDRLSGEEGHFWLEALNKFNRKENPWVMPIIVVPPDIDKELSVWAQFWNQVAGIKINTAKVKIPAFQEGFNQLIVMPEEVKMTNQGIFELCSRHFEKPCWKVYGDLDKDIVYHDRHPDRGSYAIWVRDRQEADEENKNLSPRHFWDEEPDNVARLSKIATETYLERMVHGLFYFKQTSYHLDKKYVTLCPASRDDCGRSPSVSFYPAVGRVSVDYCGPDYHFPRWRARSAVS